MVPVPEPELGLAPGEVALAAEVGALFTWGCGCGAGTITGAYKQQYT